MTITLETPQSYRIYQRDKNNQAAVRVAGTYTGSPAAIEYQFAGKEWRILQASIDNGRFAGTVNLPMMQGEFRVRFVDPPSIQACSKVVGVGYVFPCE